MPGYEIRYKVTLSAWRGSVVGAGCRQGLNNIISSEAGVGTVDSGVMTRLNGRYMMVSHGSRVIDSLYWAIINLNINCACLKTKFIYFSSIDNSIFHSH